jgi:hypothetical protein
MVARIQLTHLFHCDEVVFWRDFADDEFNRELFLSEMGYPVYNVLERRSDGPRLWRRLEITPKVDLPAGVAKIVGSALTFLEEGEYDGEVYRFTFLSPPGSFAADLATSTGVIRTEPGAGGTTKRTIDVTCEIRMFGVGRMLESAAVKIAQDTYSAQAVAWNALLAKRR